MLHFSVLLQLEGWWLQNLPCIIANAFNRGWEQFLARIAHGSNHPTQLQHVPPSPFCLSRGWEDCRLGGLGMAEGWSGLLKKKCQGGSHFCVCSPWSAQPRGSPLQWGWSRVGAPAKSSHPAAPQPTHGTPCTQGNDEKGDNINPLCPLRTPASRAALAPIPSASAPTEVQAHVPPPPAPYRVLKGNYRFLPPLMERISLLSLTASDNEGQFKNRVKIQQPHAHAHSAESLFHLKISTRVSKEMGGRRQAGRGISSFSCGLWKTLRTELWPSPNLSFIWAA